MISPRRPNRVQVRTIGHNRELGTRIARSEANALHDERRASVYDPAARYAPDDPPILLPPEGPLREALVARVRELKADGLTHVAVGVELGLEAGQVSYLCRLNGIPSASPRRGWEGRA